MGFNTTVIVLNDALEGIENDISFGRKLAAAIRSFGNAQPERVDVSAGSFVNAASVIETHHSSQTAIVAVGGNFATCLLTTFGARHHEKETQFGLAEELLDEVSKAKPGCAICGKELPRSGFCETRGCFYQTHRQSESAPE